jgi:hypothetical protein
MDPFGNPMEEVLLLQTFGRPDVGIDSTGTCSDTGTCTNTGTCCNTGTCNNTSTCCND